MKSKFSKENILIFLKHLIKNPIFYAIFLMIGVDIMTKWILLKHFNMQETAQRIFIIPNVLYVTLKFNTGAAGGIFSSQGGRIFLLVLRSIMFFAIPIFYFIYGRGIKTRYKVCLAMIYAGCVGNLIDNIFYHNSTTGFEGVVDWIGITFFFPGNNLIFNLADSFITISLVLLIIYIIIDEVKDIKERNRKGEYTLTPEEYEKKLKEEKKKNETNNK